MPTTPLATTTPHPRTLPDERHRGAPKVGRQQLLTTAPAGPGTTGAEPASAVPVSAVPVSPHARIAVDQPGGIRRHSSHKAPSSPRHTSDRHPQHFAGPVAHSNPVCPAAGAAQ